MSRPVNYTGPSCGRYVDEPNRLTAKRAFGYALAALSLGYFTWLIVSVVFVIGD